MVHTDLTAAANRVAQKASQTPFGEYRDELLKQLRELADKSGGWLYATRPGPDDVLFGPEDGIGLMALAYQDHVTAEGPALSVHFVEESKSIFIVANEREDFRWDEGWWSTGPDFDDPEDVKGLEVFEPGARLEETIVAWIGDHINPSTIRDLFPEKFAPEVQRAPG